MFKSPINTTLCTREELKSNTSRNRQKALQYESNLENIMHARSNQDLKPLRKAGRELLLRLPIFHFELLTSIFFTSNLSGT